MIPFIMKFIAERLLRQIYYLTIAAKQIIFFSIDMTLKLFLLDFG
jgi:hypothetical protein